MSEADGLKKDDANDPIKKIILNLSEEEVYFLYWTMKFIEGGISEEDERQRAWMEFEFKKLLVDCFGFDYQDFLD